MIQADAAYRGTAEGLNNIYVRTNNNVMAPVSEFVTLKRVYGPEFINRFNMFHFYFGIRCTKERI
jgi:HAE1 family hydrophobic/amphiphilic exporter-1